MNKSVNYGDIWYVDLDPTIGHEQAKLRPCLVISNDIFNNGPAELIVILPITSKYKPINWLVEINLKQKKSYIISNQPRTVSKLRFKKYIDQADVKIMKAVSERLKILLNF